MNKKVLQIVLVILLLALYFAVLNRYGTAIPAPVAPEEVNFAALARNIAEGQGAFYTIPSDIVPLPHLEKRRVYIPVLSYALALSGWGKALASFHLLSLRWFSRILGALALVLLLRLAQRWGAPFGLALLGTWWTSMDIAYQLSSNLVRPEMFSLFWILLGLWMFTEAWEHHGASLYWSVSGICFAVALFAHFWLGFYLTAWLIVVLLWRRQWDRVALFLFPITIAGVLWFLFVLQDWEWFLHLSRMTVDDKVPSSGWGGLARVIGLNGVRSLVGLYPSNAPLWSAIVLMWAWAGIRRHVSLPIWQQGTIWVAYWTVFSGGHVWYIGWFTPFGYLTVVLLMAWVWLPQSQKWGQYLLLALVLFWSAYQVTRVTQCWKAAPVIQETHQRFFQELKESLPPHASFGLYSIPDPSFALLETRPDLTLYVASGYTGQATFFRRLDGVIATPGWGTLWERFPYKVVKVWRLPSVEGSYIVLWVEPLEDK